MACIEPADTDFTQISLHMTDRISDDLLSSTSL